MSLPMPTWAEVLHAATTRSLVTDGVVGSGATTAALTEGAAVTSDRFAANTEHFIAHMLGEKKDDKKTEKKGKKDEAPKKAKADDKPAPKKKTPEAPTPAKAPYAKLAVERTPSAMRAAAMAVAAILGGPGYMPRGETPEAIINYALILYSKTGHVSTVDSVAATALQFATHMGIKWDRRYMDDDLKRLLKEDCGCGSERKLYAEDAEDITTSMYQTNPLLRRQAVELVSLMLLALGYKDAAAELQTRDDWSTLMKQAQFIHANSQKIGGGRGGEEFEDALKLRFIEMGLIVTEDAVKQDLKADVKTQHGKKKAATSDARASSKPTDDK